MNKLIESWIKNKSPISKEDYLNQLKEVAQQIALLGLSRAHFFQHAAFYGGTCLRVFHGLNRYSEDLDFSLLKKAEGFDLSPYLAAIQQEFQGFGFEMEVEEKAKTNDSAILSAFIKADTKVQLLHIHAPHAIVQKTPSSEKIKIKFELDTMPPLRFKTEMLSLFNPIPFSVLVYQPSDLFAGKIHALLCRSWKTRIKGRDWFDFVWYVSHQIPVNLVHLRERLIDSGHWDKKDVLTEKIVKKMLQDKIEGLDIELAKADVLPFIADAMQVELWTPAFFKQVLEKLVFVSA